MTVCWFRIDFLLIFYRFWSILADLMTTALALAEKIAGMSRPGKYSFSQRKNLGFSTENPQFSTKPPRFPTKHPRSSTETPCFQRKLLVFNGESSFVKQDLSDRIRACFSAAMITKEAVLAS